jgi:hypothetical protein
VVRRLTKAMKENHLPREINTLVRPKVSLAGTGRTEENEVATVRNVHAIPGMSAAAKRQYRIGSATILEVVFAPFAALLGK